MLNKKFHLKKFTSIKKTKNILKNIINFENCITGANGLIEEESLFFKIKRQILKIT